MVIKIANLVIECNLLFIDEFKSINKYESKEKPSYFVNSYIKEFDLSLLTDLKKKTTYYDLYSYNGLLYQVQRTIDGVFLGVIEYDSNRVNIYFKKNSGFLDEYLFTQYVISYFINSYSNAILFHSSTISYKNKGIAFSAKSGTGKSTHRRLWQKYSNALAINDDKNIILLDNDKLYIYPNPWSGKHMVDNNIVSSLDAIVFLYQHKTNEVKKLSPFQAMKLILGQIELPTDLNKEIWDKITDKMLNLPIYYYGCNMEKEAFDVIEERISEDLCL